MQKAFPTGIFLPLFIFLYQPLIKVRFDHTEGSRSDVQKKTVELHVGVTAAQGLFRLALHVKDLQVSHIILQIVGGVFRNIVVYGGDEMCIRDRSMALNWGV